MLFVLKSSIKKNVLAVYLTKSMFSFWPGAVAGASDMFAVSGVGPMSIAVIPISQPPLVEFAAKFPKINIIFIIRRFSRRIGLHIFHLPYDQSTHFQLTLASANPIRNVKFSSLFFSFRSSIYGYVKGKFHWPKWSIDH